MRKAELLLQKVIVCVVKMSIQHETTGKDKRCIWYRKDVGLKARDHDNNHPVQSGSKRDLQLKNVHSDRQMNGLIKRHFSRVQLWTSVLKKYISTLCKKPRESPNLRMAQSTYNLGLELSARVTAAAANTTALRSLTLATDVVDQCVGLERMLKLLLTEDNLTALLPHFSDDSLSWIYNASEPMSFIA